MGPLKMGNFLSKQSVALKSGLLSSPDPARITTQTEHVATWRPFADYIVLRASYIATSRLINRVDAGDYNGLCCEGGRAAAGGRPMSILNLDCFALFAQII